jgi:hypothetical protein
VRGSETVRRGGRKREGKNGAKWQWNELHLCVVLLLPRCEFPECDRSASYGVPGSTHLTHCAGHGKLVGMQDIRSKKCQAEGCDRHVHYGVVGTTRRTHCALHGRPLKLVDLRHRAFREAPRANPDPDPDHPDADGGSNADPYQRQYFQRRRRCTHEGCQEWSVFFLPDMRVPTYCAMHGFVFVAADSRT